MNDGIIEGIVRRMREHDRCMEPGGECAPVPWGRDAIEAMSWSAWIDAGRPAVGFYGQREELHRAVMALYCAPATEKTEGV